MREECIVKSKAKELVEILFPLIEQQPFLRPKIRDAIDTDPNDYYTLDDFLRLTSELSDLQVEETMSRLQKTIEDLDYSREEVDNFHELFLHLDSQQTGAVTLNQLIDMLDNICKLHTEHDVETLTLLFASVTGCRMRLMDFSQFLTCMRKIWDDNIAGIKAKIEKQHMKLQHEEQRTTSSSRRSILGAGIRGGSLFGGRKCTGIELTDRRTTFVRDHASRRSIAVLGNQRMREVDDKRGSMIKRSMGSIAEHSIGES
jgi:Ca2+-binding EF-hand superfamily protein